MKYSEDISLKDKEKKNYSRMQRGGGYTLKVCKFT